MSVPQRKSKAIYEDYLNPKFIPSELKRRAITGAGITVTLQVMGHAIQMISTIVLARLLTPNDFGLVAMVAAFSLLLQNFGVNGFAEVVLQKKKIEHEQITNLFWITICISTALTLIFMALSPFMAAFYKEPRLISIACVMALTIIASGASTYHIALLRRNMQFFTASAIRFTAIVSSVIVAISLALHGYGYWAIVSRRLCLPFISVIGSWSLCSWRPGLPHRIKEVVPMVKFALNVYASFTINYFRRNLDKILIGRYYGSDMLGYYDRSYHLSGMIADQLIMPLSGVAISSLSRLKNDPDKYRHYFSKVLSSMAFICMPVSALLTLIGKDLILLLLGPQWDMAGAIFSGLGPSIGMIVLYSTQSWLHISLGRADRLLINGIVSFIVTITAICIGLPFGPLGVAIAYSSSFYVLLFPALWYAGRPLDLKLLYFFSSIIRFWISALLAGIASWYILYYFNVTNNMFVDLAVFKRILISSVIYSVFYLFFIVGVHWSMEPIVQNISLIKRMVSKDK